MSPTPLLVAGYTLAIPGTMFVRRIVRRRWLAAFVGLEVGTALIVTGWTLRKRWSGVAVNTAALVGFAFYWVKGRPDG